MPLTPISIALSSFNKVISIDSSGKISTNYFPEFDSYDATATIGVSLIKFKQMFGISTSHVNVNDIVVDDLKYLVYSNNIPKFKPNLHLNNIVIDNQINPTDPYGNSINQLIQKDFVRYLAKLLFNTSLATDLFTNEDELCNSVSTALIQMWDSCVIDLQKISTSGTSPLLKGDMGEYYLDGTANSIYNICKEIYSIMTKIPDRFAKLSSLEITDPLLQIAGKKQYYLPFIHGDYICMRLRINPNENQNLFGLSRNNIYTPPKFDSYGKLLGRTYLIKMKLILFNFRKLFIWALSRYLLSNAGVFVSIKIFFYMTFNYYLVFCLKNNTICYLLTFINEFKKFFK